MNNQTHRPIYHAQNGDWRNLPVTERQEEYLREWGMWRDGMNRGSAGALIGRIKAKLARMTPEDREAERLDAQRLSIGTTDGREPIVKEGESDNTV